MRTSHRRTWRTHRAQKWFPRRTSQITRRSRPCCGAHNSLRRTKVSAPLVVTKTRSDLKQFPGQTRLERSSLVANTPTSQTPNAGHAFAMPTSSVIDLRNTNGAKRCGGEAAATHHATHTQAPRVSQHPGPQPRSEPATAPLPSPALGSLTRAPPLTRRQPQRYRRAGPPATVHSPCRPPPTALMLRNRPHTLEEAPKASPSRRTTRLCTKASNPTSAILLVRLRVRQATSS